MFKQLLFKKNNRLSTLCCLALTAFFFSCESDSFLDQTSSAETTNTNKRLMNNSIQKQKWMEHLTDEAWLKDISLVGSQGSLVTPSTNGLVKQRHGLQQQFEAGVRMFDFELKTDGNLSENDFYLSYDDIPIQAIVKKGNYNSLLAPREYNSPIRFSNTLNELKEFVAWNPSEFIIIYVHKSTSTPYDEYKRILKKFIDQSTVINNFKADTRLRNIRSKILVMEINDKDGRSYLDHNNERVHRNVNEYVTSGGGYQWKLNQIYDGIYCAQKYSLQNYICITYASGSSHYVSHQALADYVLSPTADYIKNHLQQPYATAGDGNIYYMQRSGFIFANFVTSDDGHKLIDTCINQSITTNDGTHKGITHGAYMWIYGR
ncbi:MAG TPA: hypothetical protein PK776_05020 [Flavobacterium sp.]|nr:hypothetical protein [Flavobacterium sp.]